MNSSQWKTQQAIDWARALEIDPESIGDAAKRSAAKCLRESVRRIAELQVENATLKLKLKSSLRECDHCGALMPPERVKVKYTISGNGVAERNSSDIFEAIKQESNDD